MIQVRTPCRLHFGLLAYNPKGPRQFGGAGVMIQRPDIAVVVQPNDRFSAAGPMADRAEQFARHFADRAAELGVAERVGPTAIRVIRAPRSHCGLGTGTQLAMAIGRAMATLAGRHDLVAADLARLVDRGKRSAVGAYGFCEGGFIVEGGKNSASALSPKLMHVAFPEEWRIVLIVPQRLEGICGQRERQVFTHLPTVKRHHTAEMCRLVLLGLAPALVERDLAGFSEALYELQRCVGQCFQAVQGGVYADGLLAQIVEHIRGCGIPGVGQSSWGPALYAICGSEEQGQSLADDLRSEFDLCPKQVLVTGADNHGNTLRHIEGT